MAICSVCMQSKEATALYVGEERVLVAQNVCRGCRMSVEKVLNFITYRGYRVHLSMQARLWPDATSGPAEWGPPDARPNQDGHGGEGLGSDPQTPIDLQDPTESSKEERLEAPRPMESPEAHKKRLRAS